MNNLLKLSERLQKNKRLESLLVEFNEYHNIKPCIGVEIEFYLSENINIKEFGTIIGHKVKSEKGVNQYEIDLDPTTELLDYIEIIHCLKKTILSTARDLNGYADFRSKPFANDYGSSVHFHISFIRDQKYIENAFFIEHSARSVCNFMLDSFLVFLPIEEDYKRLDYQFMTPTNISFGGNNRTTAIRIPDSYPKRIEHRLSAPSVDLYLAMFVILKSILHGIEQPNDIDFIPKIHGNAYDSQYTLTKLPQNIDAAQKCFKENFFL